MTFKTNDDIFAHCQNCGHKGLLLNFTRRKETTMNDNTPTNNEMVAAHAVDQPQPTTEEQAASCGLTVEEYLRLQAAAEPVPQTPAS